MTDDADPRAITRNRVLAVRPFDGKEAADQAEILRWIDSGAPLYRTAGPDSPPQHLCVYFALIDDASRSVLLIHHVKAQMWLPPGGHVDEGEDPRDTAQREAMEELGIDARFHPVLGPGDEAFFLSITKTGDEPPHVDVTVWFAFACAQGETLRPDPREISAIRWVGLDEAVDWGADCYDPQMGRFIRKLTAVLGSVLSKALAGSRGTIEVGEDPYDLG
jgi:8-oxo-dGTP diphosphatase